MKDLKMKHDMMAHDMNEGYYPSLTVPGDKIPELSDKKVGSVCRIVVEVRIKGMRKDRHGEMIDLEIMKGEYSESDDKSDD